MLEAYRRKRDPAKTPEPFDGHPSEAGPIFVVQRHSARRLHYDLRLERHGALASWAVPKGVPLRPGDRHLAVHVEDHPLDYASFEGTIPAGEYGAGSVELWDGGSYRLVEEKRDGGLTVALAGSRLRGVWTLVPASLDGKPENWLLIRKDAGPQSHVYSPMLASSAPRLPTGANWTFEPKWDGFRAIATIAAGTATFRSRNDNDLTSRFAGLAALLPAGVRSPDAVVDGEICAFDEAGRSTLSTLQRDAGAPVLVAFDLLELDGEQLLERPLAERRSMLERLITPGNASLFVSPQFADGEALLQAAAVTSLEGIVAKRLDSVYRPGRRSQDWRKIKIRERQEFVIAGWTPGNGSRATTFGALVLGVWEGGELRYAGNVGSGFTDDEARRLARLLLDVERSSSPFSVVPSIPGTRPRELHWVEPVLVAEVMFAEWTPDRKLRAPVFVGLRCDKAAEEVRRERAPLTAELRKGSRVLRLTNLEKPFWPEEGISKGDLLAYYRDVAHALVPHLRGRPFTMKRYPDGWQGKSFFQKHAPTHMPDWIPRAPFPASNRDGERRTIEYAVVNDELALLWMVSMGCIDLHAWSSRIDRPERPDWVLFDLDPSDDVGFSETMEVALLLKEALDLLGLASFPKTSGSRGIHVLAPIGRRHDYGQTRDFAAIVGRAIAHAHPRLVTTEWAKAKRRGVLIDANQNGLGRTTASVYSVRPRAGAAVSTPLSWGEVQPGLDPAAFTMDVVLDRIARHGDLFAGALGGKQSLTAALRSVRPS